MVNDFYLFSQNPTQLRITIRVQGTYTWRNWAFLSRNHKYFGWWTNVPGWENIQCAFEEGTPLARQRRFQLRFWGIIILVVTKYFIDGEIFAAFHLTLIWWSSVAGSKFSVDQTKKEKGINTYFTLYQNWIGNICLHSKDKSVQTCKSRPAKAEALPHNQLETLLQAICIQPRQRCRQL